jgi:RNA polymerase sigma factor (sigma-70 family)
MKSPEDMRWFRSLVEQFEGPLTRYAARITGDPDRARDVAQDTFLRLFGQERAAIERHHAQWLFTVCRNRALDVRRKESRMKTIDETAFVHLESDAPRPAVAIEKRETLGRVFALVDKLPPRQQEVIRLKFQEGLSYKQISGITSFSVSYVGVLIHEGMKTLRVSLGALTPEA